MRLFEHVEQNRFKLKENNNRSAEMMQLLQIDPADPKAYAKLMARMVGIGLGKSCGRCGGTGEYSYSKGGQATSGVCFQCDGKRRIGLESDDKNLALAKHKVENGELTRYFERNKQNAIALKEMDKIKSKFFDTFNEYWSKLDSVYQSAGADNLRNAALNNVQNPSSLEKEISSTLVHLTDPNQKGQFIKLYVEQIFDVASYQIFKMAQDKLSGLSPKSTSEKLKIIEIYKNTMKDVEDLQDKKAETLSTLIKKFS